MYTIQGRTTFITIPRPTSSSESSIMLPNSSSESSIMLPTSSFESSIMIKLFKLINDLEITDQSWNYFHISIVGGYISNLSTTCHFPHMPSAQFLITHHPWEYYHGAYHPMVVSFKQELKKMFAVPRLNTFYQTQNQINKFHLLEAFLSLLLQLLYHKTRTTVGPFKDRIHNLEKELRFLLTILGDISWMLLDKDKVEAEFQNLLPEFEALANQAGSFVHYLFFSPNRAFERIDEELAAVLNQTYLLEANLESSISASAYTTPKTSIIDSILILDSVVDDLEDLLKREYHQIADVKDQLIILHHELLLSHSLIKDMRSPQHLEKKEVKEAMMRIGGVAHQAEYLITSFLGKDAPLWYVVKRLTHLNQNIVPIRTELQVITDNYKFGGLTVAELPFHDKRNTEVNDAIVGFEDKTEEILYQLVGGGTQSLQVISILGMPGLGKTTLAKKLYNHPSVSYRFDKLSWCVVSQTYETQSILVNILSHINSEVGKCSILELKEHIHKTLMRRRYLIVLDDVWDSNVLDELLTCFPNDGNGSRVLLTSRNKDVAPPPPNSIIHELPFLSDEQCWELLEKKVFGSRDCPPQLHGIGKKIAARCCGLPLTVVVIAGALSTVDEKQSTWEEVRGRLASYFDGEDNSVMQILELSYKHLPDHLKPCFLYFGEFEEDEEISVGKLKRLWVAEGFIRKEKDKSAENIAGEYLMELINKNLVMIAKRRINGRGAKSCVVHDLLRDLCLKKSKEESFLKYLNNEYHTIYENGHRVRAFNEIPTLSYCQHVRSFVGNYPSSSFYVRDMRLLRVLHFKGFYLSGELTFGIEYLINLRYLVIGNLPLWIDRLVNLEYLRIDSTRRIYLTPAIVKLKKLRYLHANNDVEYVKDWNISNQTNNLEYLSYLIIRKLEDEEELKCSPHLRKLECEYFVDAGACPHFDLRFLSQLESLYLAGFLIKKDFGFPSNIRKLSLCETFLPWEKMSVVGRLECLEVLNLFLNAFVGERWDTRGCEFQKLRFLKLYDLFSLREWNVASDEHFPKLQQLILMHCTNLQEIPSELGEITALELIEVKWGCLKSVVEFITIPRPTSSSESSIMLPNSSSESSIMLPTSSSESSIMLPTSSSESSITLKLFELINDMKITSGNFFHISIVGGYISNLSTTCHFPHLPSAQWLITHLSRDHDRGAHHPVVVSFKQELKKLFTVPRLNTFYQTQNQINKFHLLEAFLSLLLQLLYHKTPPTVGPFKDRIHNLEKELRFLLTILGDISWMLLDKDEVEAEFQNLLPEFEALANQAGSFVHYLFFSPNPAFERIEEELAAVLNQTYLLEANLESSISASAYTTTPKTSMVDSILILDSVVEDLEGVLKREYHQIADVKDQLIILHHELLLSHSLINDMRSLEIEEVKEAMMRIGGVAHQAEYLITSFLVKDAPLWYVVKRLTHLNQNIVPIRTELQVITHNYKFGGLTVAELPFHDKRNTEVNDVTVGFEDKIEEILYQLVGRGTESLQVISILGMPGLGKTTLANKLYNHPSVSYRFDKLSWCVVSQTYETQSILANILSHINSEVGKCSILEMKVHIHKTLMGRRYLIVLDDVWDSNVLDDLLTCFPDDGNGSRVLLTSRNKDVAPPPPNSIIHELPLLSDEQCWELLEKKVFGSRTCPPQLHGIGKKIAARCCGLPLTVVVIAGALSTVDEKQSTWEEVRGRLASYIDGEDNSVMQILELSYKHLPDHLKPCFLYFGEFEEDEEISVGQLKRLWVAEGFIRKEKDKSAENIAGEYLMELINKSLVMIAKRKIDGRGAQSCVVHDLLRDLCLKKSKEESFLKYLNSEYHTIYENGHRVRAFNEIPTLSYCQHVRSFVGNYPSSSFYVRDMRLLRVLHFKGFYLSGELTFGIEYLINLRYLVIGNLPLWIDRLVNLEYLRIDSTRRIYLTPAIVKLKKLRYLHANNDVEYVKDWNISNQTNNLEYLSYLIIRKLEDEEELKCSPHLRKLECEYFVDDGACPHFDLRFLSQLESLYLAGFLIKKDFGFPSNIRKLSLYETYLPWEKMSVVGRLECLEVLNLFLNAFVGERWDTRGCEFQKLRFLKLYDLFSLREWNVASDEHFPKLQQLILMHCTNLQEIPSELGEITALELIELYDIGSYCTVEDKASLSAAVEDKASPQD
ncbi:hypothetical protein ACS0TY_022414 [Phlomoides rotata]